MKTYLAVIAAMLFGVLAAAAAQADSSLQPYTAFTWSPVSRSLRHSSQMYGISLNVLPAVAARTLSNLSPGRRVVLIAGPAANSFDFDPVKAHDGTTYPSPWLDKSRKLAAAKWMTWQKQYVAVGGPAIDFVAVDAEFGWSIWNASNSEVASIQSDPRYAELARRFHVTQVTPKWYSPQWDDAMTSLRNDTLRQTFGTLAKSLGNYDDEIVPATLSKQCVDYNGWPSLGTTLMGTHQCPDFYSWVGQIRDNRADGTHPDFAHDPLATVIWSADRARVFAQAPQPVMPWFAWKSVTQLDNLPIYVGATPYWDEMLWQVLLSTGSTNVLAWNVKATQADNAALDHDLATFASETQNTAVLKPLTHAPVPMNADWIVSGVRAGNRRVYRVTVKDIALTKRSIEAQLPGEAKPSTIEIPGGQAGVWIVKPDDSH